MAKITMPLMSLEASGVIAKFLTFSKRNSGQQVRWQLKQKDVITPLRTIQRAQFLRASTASRLPEYGDANYGYMIYGFDISEFNLLAKNLFMSGYNLAIKKVIKLF